MDAPVPTIPLANLILGFLPVAARQCFLEIASPSLATPPSLSRHKTVNKRSLLREAFLNTRPKAAASSNRFALRNRYGELPAKGDCSSAAVIAKSR